MDNNKDISLVKEAFDQLQYKAPDIWNNLSQALDDELIDQKVAQSFSEQNFVAPTFDALFEAENVYDNIVKESFEQTKVAAPENAWDKIADGLTTEDVWSNIADKIVVHKLFKYNWAASVAAAFLVFIAPFGLSDSSNNELFVQNESNENVVEIIGEEETEALFASNNLVENELNNTVSNLNIQDFEVSEQIETTQELIPTENRIKQLDIEKFPSAQVNSLINQTTEQQLTIPIRPVIDKKRHNFSVQLIGGVERSWIADNQTREAFDRNSIVRSKFSLGSYYGIGFKHEFESHFGYEVNLLKGEANNRLGTYNHGYYNVERSHIEYYKLAALANYNLPINSKMKFETAAGVSALFIQQSQHFVNDELTSTTNHYTNFSAGLLGRIGPTYSWNNFSLNLSLTAEIGLNNIFAGTEFLSSELNPTNLMGLGLSAGLRYKL